MDKFVQGVGKLILAIGLTGLMTSTGLGQTATTSTPTPAKKADAPSGKAGTAATPATKADATASKPVTVGTTTPPATPGTTEELAPMYVTGSVIPTTETQGAQPVITIGSQEIERRGYSTVNDILRNVSSNGSFSNPGVTSGNFAAGGAYASLRGLGPQATLVLINGQRVVDYAAPANGQFGFVDLNSIPAAIVDRVEVLSDGSALYGADAVAGVINIITKTDLGSAKAEVETYFGDTTNKDAFNQRYTISGSLSSFDKNGTGIVEADYEHQNSILAPDRGFSASSDQSAQGGFDLRSGRTYPGIFEFGHPKNLKEFYMTPGVGNVPLTSTNTATNKSISDDPNSYPYYDYNRTTTILPETDRYGTYLNYSYKFYNGNIVPDIDFDYRHNRTHFQQAPAGWTIGDGSAPNSPEAIGVPDFTVPRSNPYNQTGHRIYIESYRFTDLGPRVEDVDQDTFRVVPSVNFKLSDKWTLNTAFNYGYSSLDDRNSRFPSADAFQHELNGKTLATAYNPFTSEGSNNQQVINNLLTPSWNTDSTSLIGETFRFNGSVFDLPAGPVQVAFGGEYRLERYDQHYSPSDRAGLPLGSTVQLDTSASRKALSGYTEVDFPITSPAFNCPGCQALDVIVAGRVDQYSNFGHTQNPEVNVRWETVPGLILRGSYTTAFRAPGLPELFAGGNQAVSEVFDPVAKMNRDVTINGGGNPDLKPETAEIFGGGVAYSPQFVKGLVFTADYFKIRYTNQIVQEDPQTLVDEKSNQVTHNPDGTIGSITATYSNQSSTEVQGIDWGLNYVVGDPEKDWGQLNFSLGSSWMLSYVTDNGTGATENVGQDSGGVGAYPRYRQTASLFWDYRAFEFGVSNNYTAGYFDSSVAQYGIVRNVAAVSTFDLQASYTFDRELSKIAPPPHGGGFDWRGIIAGTKFSVGVNNVVDSNPPFTANPSTPLGYDTSYADGEGRFIYGSIKKTF